ncbi:MAG: DUF2110 family protein [Candidatus Bathyarchaeota archaeon]|jgi:hypothetical protein|nr:DUF2110 family protein [Candidatus Bathyarchaeota archaeon]
MPTVTLVIKVYDESQLEMVNKSIKSILKGLKVETKICQLTPRGMVQINVSGEDEKAALNYLDKEIGICPTSFEKLNKYSEVKGHISSLNKSKTELYVDIGISSPRVLDAAIPIQRLQAQLVDRRKIALKKLVELFGFCEHLPLTIKILDINKEKNFIEATVSERQIAQYKNWTKSFLDRLIILGPSLLEARLALKRARVNRDIIDIEPLGLFENAVACKLGTDAVGLIPKIGKILGNSTFSVFSPKKILEFMDYSTPLISE